METTTYGRKVSCIEMIALRTLKLGDVFYSVKNNAIITAIAAREGVKVSTQRMIAIDSNKCSRIERLTKVTIL